MTLDLTDRVAVVTGGASGIGAGICRMLAAAGARVVVADIDEAGARAVADEVGGLAVRCDVREREDSEAALRIAVDVFGAVDVVVLGAGVEGGFSLDRFDEARYRRVVGVNLDGVVFGLAASLPALRSIGGGRVVVVASLAGLAPVPLDPVYAATKAAVVSLVRSVGPGLAAEGIRVNAVCPAFTDTPIVDPVRDVLAAMRVPLMPVSDVVDAVAEVLASDGSGEAWLVQHGRPAQPYAFRGVPGPVRAPGGSDAARA
jgi:NAD(P)-dependent dehydrogenase (short-subunit alcohol dehydrogenase family)